MSLRSQINSQSEIIKDLQLSYKGVESSLAQIANKTNQPNTENVAVRGNNDAGTEVDIQPSPKVVIFHDSLCKPINDTIMSREKVNVEKIWAPTLQKTDEEADKLENVVDCIVVQALTREVEKKVPGEYVEEVSNTVNKCLSKCKRVVLSLVVDREDSQIARTRAKAVNGLLQVKYIDEPNVVVCEHESLRDPRNRRSDKLHLNEVGTSKLATNLKHKIAEALGITVVKKANTGWKDRRNNNRNNFYGNKRNNGYFNNRDRPRRQHYDDRYNMYEEFEEFS